MKNKAIALTIVNLDYLDQAKQLILSLCKSGHWQEDLGVILVSPEDNPKIRQEFEAQGVQYFHQASSDNPDPDMQKSGRDLSVCLSKCLCFGEQFKKWKTVVYFDADIIITNSIRELEEELPVPFMAVKAASTPLSKQVQKRFWSKYRSEGYNLLSHCFNAGFFALDPRRVGVSQDEVSHMMFSTKMEATCGEQLGLNLALYNKWKALSNSYNYLVATLGYSNSSKVKVLHFGGENLPWQKDHKLYSVWSENLAQFNQLKAIKAAYKSEKNPKHSLVYKDTLNMKTLIRFLKWKIHSIIYLLSR